MSERQHALEDAAGRIEACRDLEPESGRQCFHEAYLQVVGLRNRLLRAEQREGLSELNALLSLMSSVQFPLAGIHRDRLQAIADGIGRLLEAPTSAGRRHADS